MRAAITGINGFVGGHLVEHLADAGDSIIGLSRSGQWPEPIPSYARNAEIEPFDLVRGPTDKLIDWVRRNRPEAIYHLAAQANPRESFDDPESTWELNLGGTLTLLEAVRHAKVGPLPRIILAGSGVAYGNPRADELPVTESCPLRPNNPYAASKAAADLLGIQQTLAFKQHVIVARPFNHAGPRQSDRYVLSSFARQVVEVERGDRDRIEVGNLEVVRDFTDVRDIVIAYRLLALRGKPGEIYNIGTGRNQSLTSLLEILQNQARVPVEVVVDPDRVRPVDLPLLLADSSKLREETGWEPRYSIEQTLADMLGYWREMLN